MPAVLDAHDRIVRDTIAMNGGVFFKHTGDGMCAAFSTAAGAVTAAVVAQRALAREPSPGDDPLRVRMAILTGTPIVRWDDYAGPPLNRCARLLATAHGGQIIASAATADLIREGLGSGVTLIDLGRRELRDLARSEHVFQVTAEGLDVDFPPLRSLGSGEVRLPAVATSLVGREQELKSVAELLGSHRLVVITGPGGCGKTRLAIEAASMMASEFADGAAFVDLRAVSDEPGVAPAVATAVGLALLPGVATSELLTAGLSRRHLLVVLGNCEHVVDACAALCESVLAGDSRVHLLATSPEALAAPG